MPRNFASHNLYISSAMESTVSQHLPQLTWAFHPTTTLTQPKFTVRLQGFTCPSTFLEYTLIFNIIIEFYNEANSIYLFDYHHFSACFQNNQIIWTMEVISDEIFDFAGYTLAKKPN